jgi:predicted acetyltransferase
MPELITPTVGLHRSWLESRDEWGHDSLQEGGGLRVTDEVDSAEGFAAWVNRLIRTGDETIPAEEDWVHTTYWWIVENSNFLGAINLRHRLNDSLLVVGGHIGHGIRPSARGRGLASWALGAVLAEARLRGMDRVLLTCRAHNLASARVIERNGGALEKIHESDAGPTRRYWIDL